MSKKGHVPLRTCMGCRKKKKKEEMIRLTQSPEGVLSVNGEKPHQRRGFYICPDFGCLTMAKKKNRRVEFLETMDFHAPSAKGFIKNEKVWDRGGRG